MTLIPTRWELQAERKLSVERKHNEGQDTFRCWVFAKFLKDRRKTKKYDRDAYTR